MQESRTSGVLLHITSLPGRFGIGDLGPEAFDFVDFLAEAKQGLWQVLPLRPTGFGDSPYQCLSTRAGNPLLISPEGLVGDGLLEESALSPAPDFPTDSVDFGLVQDFRSSLLRQAFANLEAQGGGASFEDDFSTFKETNAGWLDDFALFMAVKAGHQGRAWVGWTPEIRRREPSALREWKRRSRGEIEFVRFQQFLFFRQWARLREHAAQRGIRFMGDVPIFVSGDSAEVWSQPGLFVLGDDGRPTEVAGVPPDYFSDTGQLWGNPLYRWDVMGRDGFRWWIDRLRAELELVDVVRLDHFRGFHAHWAVPSGAVTAVEGEWKDGPGVDFFQAIREELGEIPIVVENLGVITPEVEALRARFAFPGMAILQFAFGGDGQFLPHNLTRDCVIYTGTHDNDTTVGWWSSEGESSSLTGQEASREKARAREYLDTDGDEINWVMIRAALSSVARTAVIPAQDLLGLGSESRMNRPGRPEGNWGWRLRPGALTSTVASRLGRLTELFGRNQAGAGKTESSTCEGDLSSSSP